MIDLIFVCLFQLGSAAHGEMIVPPGWKETSIVLQEEPHGPVIFFSESPPSDKRYGQVKMTFKRTVKEGDEVILPKPCEESRLEIVQQKTKTESFTLGLDSGQLFCYGERKE